MRKNEQTLSQALGALALILGAALLSGTVHVVVIRDVWAWFVTPTWGIETPTFGTLYVILACVGMYTYRRDTKAERAEYEAAPVRHAVSYAVARAFGAGVVWLIAIAIERAS
jgi:hypothetical protein